MLVTGAVVVVLAATGALITPGSTVPGRAVPAVGSTAGTSTPVPPPVTGPPLPTTGTGDAATGSAPTPAAVTTRQATPPGSTQQATAAPTEPPLATSGVALPALAAPFDAVLGEFGTGRVAYLTFDDGPGPQTGRILDILRGAAVQATFCQVGSRLTDYPDTERRVLAEGHTVCNHSWSHPDNLAAAPAETINAQITQTQQAFAGFGVTAHYFRAPDGGFGKTSTTLRQLCQVNNVIPLGWSVDSEDWRKPGSPVIVTNVLTAVHPGAIILLHDAGGADRDQTIAALPGIINGLHAAGYTLAPLPPQGP